MDWVCSQRILRGFLGWRDQTCLSIWWPWVPLEAGVGLPLLDLLCGKTLLHVKQPARNRGAIKRTVLVSRCVFKNKGSNAGRGNCQRDYAYSGRLCVFQPQQFCISVNVHPDCAIPCLSTQPAVPGFGNKQILKLHICILMSFAVCLGKITRGTFLSIHI